MEKYAKTLLRAAFTGAGTAALLAAALSCRGPVALDRSIWGNTPGEATGGDGTIRKTRYVTGIEYPEGFNWQPDLGYSAEGAVLFLMRGDSRVLELAVGYANCISADADTHRCIEGHLYTDFSTDTETVIKKDGVEMFRYFDREMIVSLAERDDGIHTLGQPRSGTGWTYRVNGEIRLHKGGGSLLHGFHTDGESLCFSYRDAIETSTGTKHLYYIVRDSKVQSVPVTDNVTAIDDVISSGGVTVSIARISGISGMVVLSDHDTLPLEFPSGATGVSGCRFVSDGDAFFVAGNISGGNGPGYGDSFWKGTSLALSAGSLLKVCGYAVDNGECYFVARSILNHSLLRICRSGEFLMVPSGYDFIYSSAFGAGGGCYCMGLADTANGNAPVLWENDKAQAFDFNGVFTGVSYW